MFAGRWWWRSAFLGLFVMGLPFVATLATAGAVVVLVAVAIAVSLTPALLAVFGKRVDRRCGCPSCTSRRASTRGARGSG
ncbi:MMPL family transporter [Tepidiforma flava]|uniref:MMPL family transporter n=1 Tax=Tepidiforma flava TaxID=3004094 RepID=A0ABY7MBF3_9CHLR|nr:MMPL family transporter [Tepidiforma flava]WBL37547.1 MMPL family transporter [Tepidiforma flava]